MTDCKHEDGLNWEPDKGPWSFGTTSDGRAFLESDDFHHDVRLYIDGDFACKDCKRQYGEDLAAKLNAQQSITAAGGGEKVCSCADHVVNSVVPPRTKGCFEFLSHPGNAYCLRCGHHVACHARKEG